MKRFGAAIVAGLLAMAPASADSLFEQLAPTPTAYTHLVDYGIAGPVYYLDGPHTIGPVVADVTGSIFRLAGMDGVDGLSLGCSGSDFGGGGASGHVVLLARGTCTFAEKIRNAEDAGAIAVLMADYDPAPPSLVFAGRDDSITILGFRISADLGALLSSQTLRQSTTVRLARGDDLVSSLTVPEPATWGMLSRALGWPAA